jgi:hypothetical protein
MLLWIFSAIYRFLLPVLIYQRLEVSHKYSWYDVMTDEMAINLINTIDALIPGSQPPTRQKGRRESGELQSPKAEPAAQRPRPRR